MISSGFSLLLIRLAIFWARENAVLGIFSIVVFVLGKTMQWPFDNGLSSRMARAFGFSSILWLGISPLIIDSKIGVSGPVCCSCPSLAVAGPCCKPWSVTWMFCCFKKASRPASSRVSMCFFI